MQTADKALIDRLSQDRRNELIAIGREALCRLRYAYQHLFDAHLELFEFLADWGATATEIGEMLFEVGIKRKDGSALPAGTVSSAMSRAKERRAAQRAKDFGSVPARPGTDMQVAAAGGNALQRPADRFTTTGAIAAERAAAAPSNPHLQICRIRPSPNPSAHRLPTTTRNAADRLDQLRSNHAGQHDD